MIYNEIKQDLFKVNDDYSLVHCISLDVQMGKGRKIIIDTFNDTDIEILVCIK